MDETSTSLLEMVLSLERSVFCAVLGVPCIWCCTLRGLYLELYLVLSFEGFVFGAVFGEVWINGA